MYSIKVHDCLCGKKECNCNTYDILQDNLRIAIGNDKTSLTKLVDRANESIKRGN